MKVPIIGLSYPKGASALGYWDQGMIQHLFDGALWHPVAGHTLVSGRERSDDMTDGAVVVVAAGHQIGDVELINRDLARLPWCLVFMTSDEAHAFPLDRLDHPRMIVYEMTPRVDSTADRYLPNGWPPFARGHLQSEASVDAARRRPLDWFFAGQVTHARRKACVQQLRGMDGGVLVENRLFAQGIPHDDYYRSTASAKVIPCPSGPATPDTFRLYEALEAGCLPIADSRIPGDDRPNGYWHQLFGAELAFPVIDDWSQLPGVMHQHLQAWPATANRAFAWWQGYKRQLAYQVHEDISRLAGTKATEAGKPTATLRDRVTVLIPTSPVHSHPSTDLIETTVTSVRERLPDAEIIIMLDGVRDEQEHRRQDYEEYQRHLLWKCNHEWSSVLPLRFETHHHQAAMTRQALKLVKTPTILFVEHDAPLCGDIPFDAIVSAIESGNADLVRLLHRPLIIDEHQHLMLDQQARTLHTVPMMRTIQWSQRPHLASTDFYRRILNDHFDPDARTMIEEVMHSVAHCAYTTRRTAGWQDYKLWIYTPPGDMQRSYHLDGRGNEPAYDNPQR